VKDCGDIGEHNKMTIALEKIKSLASSHPINSSTFDLGMHVLNITFFNILRKLFIYINMILLFCSAEYVTTMLEYLNCNLGGDLESVYTTMLTIGAPIESLVAIYKK